MEAGHSDIDSFDAIRSVLCRRTEIPSNEKLINVLNELEVSLYKTHLLCESAKEKVTDLVNYCNNNFNYSRSSSANEVNSTNTNRQANITINIWSQQDGGIYTNTPH